MDTATIVQHILQRGIKNVSLSMFSDYERKQILQQVAEVYMRQGKTDEVLEILEDVDIKRFKELMAPIAEQCVELAEYKKAALIYEKLGDHELAEFIKVNFVE